MRREFGTQVVKELNLKKASALWIILLRFQLQFHPEEQKTEFDHTKVDMKSVKEDRVDAEEIILGEDNHDLTRVLEVVP